MSPFFRLSVTVQKPMELTLSFDFRYFPQDNFTAHIHTKGQFMTVDSKNDFWKSFHETEMTATGFIHSFGETVTIEFDNEKNIITQFIEN